MVDINKINTQFGDWINIKTDEGNFDLYWKYVHNGDILSSDSKTFFYY